MASDPIDFAPVIDAASSRPPFQQLKSQIESAVRSGALPAGARLPAVRVLAGDLGLAANTVAKAYRELEDDGVLEGRGRSGTFVRVQDEENATLTQAAREFADIAHNLGVSDETAVYAVRNALGGRS